MTKEDRRAYNSAYYAANRERLRERKAEAMRYWRANNPDEERRRNRAYREANPEKESARFQAWREANRERYLLRAAIGQMAARMGVSIDTIPQSLIEAKAAQLKLKRVIWEAQKNERS